MRKRSLALLAVIPLALAGCSPQPAGPMAAAVSYSGLDSKDSGQLTASGTVHGIAESGGLCSFTFWAVTGAATRLTGEGVAAGDRTECGPVTEAVGFFVGVTYSVELKYVALDGSSTTSERYPMVLPTPGDLNPK
ncbi:hypothetical protein BH11ACT4_BH11ACT4_24870 [soil metagenome]